MLVDNWAQGHVTVRKALHFAVSLVGPFYTVYGRDVVRITESKYEEAYQSTCEKIIALTVSPNYEYQAPFSHLRHCIEARFEGYRFVPFGIHSRYINGLSLRYLDGTDHTIYNALFNHLLFDRDDEKGAWISGDTHYGYDAWQAIAPPPPEWVIIPPGPEETGGNTAGNCQTTS